MPEEIQRRSLLLGIAQQVISVIIGVAIAAAWVGSTRQKVNQKVTTLETEMSAWKEEWKERDRHITKMDLEGSVATKNFVMQYEIEQAKQYKRLEKLEDKVSHLENIEYRIKRLEDERKP